MKQFLLFSLMMLLSCKQSDQYSVDSIYPIPKYDKSADIKLSVAQMRKDSRLSPFVDEFYALKAQSGLYQSAKDTFYQIKDLSAYGNVLGRCETYKNANLVLIDSHFFSIASELDLKSVVFHELGHCDLGRGHRSIYWQGELGHYSGIIPHWENSNINKPISIMNRSIIREAVLNLDLDYFMFELFHQDVAHLQVATESIND